MSEHDSKAIGLCAKCRHARTVVTPRSEFWLCERSRTDSSYERYPRLPRLECRGFEPGAPGHEGEATPPPAPRPPK
jgi:hypothetical protein